MKRPNGAKMKWPASWKIRSGRCRNEPIASSLIGGRTGAEVEGHDWEYLLNALGLSQHAQPLGYFTHFIGILLMIAALAYAAMTVLRKSE